LRLQTRPSLVTPIASIEPTVELRRFGRSTLRRTRDTKHSIESRQSGNEVKLPTEELERRARERGEMEKHAILNAMGTPLATSEVAAFLHVEESEVERLRAARQLLGLPLNGRYVYPSWQFQDNGVLPGLSQVLQALSVGDPWMRAAFFLGTTDHLAGRSPLTELKQGHVSAVVRAAQSIGEHGAA
jgi:hypothetical protein